MARRCSFPVIGGLFAVVVAGSTAVVHAAGEAEAWPFDETTTGNPVDWVSPTAVRTNATTYDTTTVIDAVIIEGLVFGSIPTGEVDVTDQIPPEFLENQVAVAGPAPIDLGTMSFEYPPPPDKPELSATFSALIDEDGFGHFSIFDVMLGTVDVEVDGFGTVEVDITSVRVVGTVTVDPIGVFGDLTGDNLVNTADLLALLAAWGKCDGCPEDLNGDGTVGTDDLLTLLSQWSA